jgi:hypothetical protein
VHEILSSFEKKRLYASCIGTSTVHPFVGKLLTQTSTVGGVVHESRKQHHAANGRHMPFDRRALCLFGSFHGCDDS